MSKYMYMSRTPALLRSAQLGRATQVSGGYPARQ
jgi:hypothetical protein